MRRITVHALSEFIFCPRAGIIANELDAGEPDDEPVQQFNVDYIPRYDLASVEESLNRQMNRFWRLLGLLIVLFLCAAVLYLAGRVLPTIALGGVIAWLSWRTAKRLNVVLELGEIREIAKSTPAKEPALEGRQYGPVNWWGLLAAGFDSVIYRESLKDDSIGLSGKPWRVLRKGSLRIPVARIASEEPTDTPRPQHVVRIAAYCHLLRSCEGQESPYGIILLGNSWDGIAISVTDKMIEQIKQGVDITRERLVEEDDKGYLESATELDLCRGCPHGFPVVADAVKGSPWWGVDATIYGVPGQDQRLYHSCCGDRFEWTPPHRKAIALKLIE